MAFALIIFFNRLDNTITLSKKKCLKANGKSYLTEQVEIEVFSVCLVCSLTFQKQYVLSAAF